MIINLESKGDESTGFLTPIESQYNLPFTIKRIYYIHSIPTQLRRGFHAHLNLKQCLIAINGSCKVLMDYGNDNKKTYELNNKNQGLIIDKMIWHEMYDFCDNCILLALADDYYKECDYVRDYQEFTILVKK
ncbi:MAG: sugar 3,4-ketoisomerase [Alphaproteobacteria bacterium]